MTLANLRARLLERPRHFSPFFVLGDPSPQLSVELARAATSAGASMLELGIPYRDPCADGPSIQRACGRAFASGMTTDLALETLAKISRACPGVPLNLLVYGNLVHARGLATFSRQLVDVGGSSLLVPDLPLGEDEPLRAACDRAGLGFVRLVAPRTETARLGASAAGCVLLYAAGVQGVTGTAQTVRSERADLLSRATATTGVPLCAGFGIRSPEDVEHAFRSGATIAVVGSRLADILEEALPHGEAALVASVATAVRDLSEPSQKPPPKTSPLTQGA